MAARKSHKKGGGSKAARSWRAKPGKNKAKYRPHDPVFNRMEGADDKHNQTPKGDSDMTGIPEPALPGGMMLPGVSMTSPGAGSLPGVPAAYAGGTKKAKRKRGKEGGLLPDQQQFAGAEKSAAAAGAAGASSTRAKQLPRQRQGESARAYAARLNKAAERQMREARQKLNTEHHREKKRKRSQAKKKATDEKRRERAAEPESKRERARFGDVVQRPPIMSSAALKSRSTLKAQAKVPGGTKAGADLLAYADKVRDAYAALRRRRLGDG